MSTLSMCPACHKRIGWDGHGYYPCEAFYPYGATLHSAHFHGVRYAVQATAGIVTVWVLDTSRDSTGVSPIGLRQFTPIDGEKPDVTLTGDFSLDASAARRWMRDNRERLHAERHTS